MSPHLRALRTPEFRYLFLGQSVSALGDQIVFVALALYITRTTGSATDLGIVLAAGSLAMVALLLFGGVWADRLARQQIMLVADAIRAVLHGVLAVSILTGGAGVAEMAVIEALFGAARAFFQPAYTGLLPQTIDAPLLQDARALSEVTSNLAALLGPAVGTALVLSFGAGPAFAIDAGSFVVSAMLLARVHPRARLTAPPRARFDHELRAGWREVRSRPWVWATIAAFSAAILCVYAQWNALAPSIARDDYGGAGVFGVLETMIGAGALLGALAGIRWRPRRPLATGLVIVLVWPLQSLAFALELPLPVVLALALGNGVSFSLFVVWWETSLASHVPPHALSRVSSYDWMGSLALMPLGFVVAGPLAAAFGARTVLGVGAVAGLAMLALALTPRSTRALSAAPSAEQLRGEVEIAGGGEAEIAHVDPLVRVVHERRGV
jgi:MFS family permease